MIQNETSKPKKYILYADDDPDDKELFLDFIKESAIDFTPQLFSDGLSLYQFLDSLQPDETCPCCIILDLNMPIWDGFKTLNAIRTVPKYKRIPIIIFTTSSDSKDQRTCLRLGADAFLTKPNTKAGNNELLALLTKYAE